MNLEGKVAIFIPTLDRVNYLLRTLNNLIDSLSKCDELNLIVFDNKSDDLEGYKAIEKSLNSHQSCYFVRFEERLPMLQNWNRCINHIRAAKYIAFYHDDDLYSIEMPSRQKEFLDKHSNVGIVCTNSNIIDSEDVIIGKWSDKSIQPLVKGIDYINQVLLQGSNFINCPSVMIRTSVLSPKPFFENLEGNGGDMVTWLTIALNHDIGYINEKLMSYRKHTLAASTSTLPQKAVIDTYNSYNYFIDEKLSNYNKEWNNKVVKIIKNKIANRYAYQSFKLLIIALLKKQEHSFNLSFKFIKSLNIKRYIFLSRVINFMFNFRFNGI